MTREELDKHVGKQFICRGDVYTLDKRGDEYLAINSTGGDACILASLEHVVDLIKVKWWTFLEHVEIDLINYEIY